MGGDVVGAGGVEERGEVGALGGGEVADVLAEVRLGGGLDAVGVAAEVAGVQVALEDVVLALLAVQFDRDEELLRLPAEGLFLAQVVVLDVLLGDGGAGLFALAEDGVPRGPQHRAGVDGRFGVEAAVLGGERRVLHGLGDLAQGHVLAVDDAVAGELGAVRVEVDVALRDGRVVRLGDVDQQVSGDEAARDEQHDEQEAAEEHAPGGQEAAPAGALGAALARLLGRPALRRGGTVAGLLLLWLLVAHVCGDSSAVAGARPGETGLRRAVPICLVRPVKHSRTMRSVERGRLAPVTPL